MIILKSTFETIALIMLYLKYVISVRYCLQNLYVENGRPVCNTSDNIHGTNCSLECSVGYELPLNTTNIVSCTTQRSTDVYWSPISTTVCKSKS